VPDDRRRRRFGDFDGDADHVDIPADGTGDLDDATGAVFGRGAVTDDMTGDATVSDTAVTVDPSHTFLPTDGADLRVGRNGPWSRYVRPGGVDPDPDPDDAMASSSTAGGPLRTRRARFLTAAFVDTGVDPAHLDTRRCSVVDVRLGAPHCRVTVTGPGAAVHAVDVRFRAFDAAAWHRLADVFAASAATGAALVDGRMPDDADALAAEVGLRLVPGPDDIVAVSCTCDDTSPRCVHAGAVAAAIVRAVDDDPLVLFPIRGMPAPAFLAALRERRRVLAAAPSGPAGASTVDADAVSADPVRFWSAGPLPSPTLPSPPRGDASAVLTDEPVTVVVGTGSSGDVTFDDLVRGAYPGIRRGAMARLRRLGDSSG
jgi:hypothetical protein